MSLFDETTPASEALKLRQRMEMQYRALTSTFASLAGVVWNNRHGFTPQQMLAALDTDAERVFVLSAATADLIGAATGTVPQVVPAGFEYEFESDGRITITAAPATSSESGGD